jgi:integrase
MRGHITRRAKDSYTVVVNLGADPETGKRRQQWVTVKGTKRDAERRLSELLSQLDSGTFVRPRKITVGEYLQQWLADYVELHCSPKTIESYRQVIDSHLVPELGGIKLVDLEARHLQTVFARKRESGLSARTVRYLYSLMSQVLRYAVKQGILNRNVAQNTEPPKMERRELNTIRPEQINIFLEAARETPHYALFYLLLHTGLRRGEALALKWKNVDMGLASLGVQAYLSITLSLSKVDGKTYIREPKTSSGRRRVALPPSLTLVLKQHKLKQQESFALLGRTFTDEDYVFCHHDGTPLDPSTVSHSFAHALRKAGLPPMPLHGLRHSHATLLLQAGTHPRVVMERLGHSSIRVTLDTYSHVVGGLQESAAQRFDDFVGAKNRSVSNPLAKSQNLESG